MKKRLLITSALMTAVLGASLATGTYAWYVASTTFTPVEGTTASGQVSVSGPTAASSSIGYTIDAQLVEETDSAAKTLILSAYDDVNDKWYSGYDTVAEFQTHTLGANEAYYKVFAIQVKGTMTGTDTNGEFATLLANCTETYTLTFANTDVDDTIDAEFWVVEEKPALNSNSVAPGSDLDVSVAVKNITGSYTTVGYLVVYIDGEADDHTAASYTAKIVSTAEVA